MESEWGPIGGAIPLSSETPEQPNRRMQRPLACVPVSLGSAGGCWCCPQSNGGHHKCPVDTKIGSRSLGSVSKEPMWAELGRMEDVGFKRWLELTQVKQKEVWGQWGKTQSSRSSRHRKRVMWRSGKRNGRRGWNETGWDVLVRAVRHSYHWGLEEFSAQQWGFSGLRFSSLCSDLICQDEIFWSTCA